VEVYVSRLRRKLEAAAEDAPLIETVRGSGYRLTLPLEAGDPVVARAQTVRVGGSLENALLS
jgi:DNA-binding winged helix-turn-helix (wHTH) protein